MTDLIARGGKFVKPGIGDGWFVSIFSLKSAIHRV